MIKMNKTFLAILTTILISGCARREPSVDIWTAAATGNTTAIEEHIRFETDLDAREPTGGSSPLIVAGLYGQGEVVRLLLEHGADVNLMNHEGSTALHTVAFFCRPELVSMLLEHGADTKLKNKYGRTPLESVSGEWTGEVEGRYKLIAGAFGLPLDLERIKATRPKVAELIRQHHGN